MKMTRKPCYYCGSPIGKSGSKEHVPPQMMFKAGTSCITVYSCQKHNQDKSHRDAVIVTSLIRTAAKEWRNLRKISPEVSQALIASQKTIEEIRKNYPDIPILSPLPENLADLPDLPFIPEAIDIRGWIRNLTAGLVYDALKGFDSTIDWDTVGVMSAHYVETKNFSFSSEDDLIDALLEWKDEEQRIKSYHWIDGWHSGPNPYSPGIYSFQLSFPPHYVYIKHRFYETVDWYARFKPALKTIDKLKQKIGL